MRKNRRVAARDKPPVNDERIGVSLDVAQTIFCFLQSTRRLKVRIFFAEPSNANSSDKLGSPQTGFLGFVG